MFTMHKERVARHPALLFVISVVLGLYCSLLFGADSSGRNGSCPGPLPTDVDMIARPIAPAVSPRAELRRAIDAHNAGRLRDAVASWRQLEVPYESAAWRHLGIGVAHLYLGELDAAAMELNLAVRAHPDNSAVHYFTGLLRREQAKAAVDYLDAVGSNGIRLAKHFTDRHHRDDLQVKTRSRFLMEAISEFEQAVLYASQLDLTQPLVVEWCADEADSVVGETSVLPTVDDLLNSLGADNFVGKAHGLLAHLYLEQERPDEAELQVDQAILYGIPVPNGYHAVGSIYQQQGRDADAVRVFAKALDQGNELAEPGVGVGEVMQNAFERLLSR